MNNRVRIYEPYGFGESYQYESIPTRIDNELSESQANDSKQFASVAYNEDAKALIFKNVGNVEQGRVYLKDIIGLETLIEKAYYDEGTKELVIVFNEAKSDVVRIPLDKIIDVTEAGNGLVQEGGKFQVLIDPQSENYLTVSQNGVKVSGVYDAIDHAFTTEQNRAVANEDVLDKKIDAENDRATKSETNLNNGLMAEIRNRESSDEDLRKRIETEITNRTSSDDILQSKIETEASNRNDGDNAIKAIIGNGFTSTPTETITQKYIDLGARIDNEISDRTTQDNVLQTNINNEVTARSGEITRVVNLITDESNLRISNIKDVNDSIANETNTRIAKDKELADNIAKETNTRINKDTELAGNIAKEIKDRENQDAALQTNINSEASKREEADTNLQAAITEHTTNTVVHVTQEDKNNWNSKIDITSIPTNVSQLANDKGYLTSNDLTDISNSLSSLETRLSSLETRLSSLESSLSTLANSLSSLETRVAALESNSL